MNKTITYFKNHPLIAVLFVIIAALVIAEITSKTVSGLADTPLNVFSGNKNIPVLVKFTLNQSKSDYIEGEVAKFGAGSQVKTFMMQPKAPDANSVSARTPYPVFNVEIENPSEKALVINKVTYNIDDIGHIMLGGGPGPLKTASKYAHTLEYKKGAQEYELISPVTIPAKSSGTFELAMMTDHPDLGLSWWTNVEFHSNRGNVSTEMFQLILSGRPGWALKVFEPQQARRQGVSLPPPVIENEGTPMPPPVTRQGGTRMTDEEQSQRPGTPKIMR